MEAKVIINLERDGLIHLHDPHTFTKIDIVFPFERQYLAQNNNLSDDQRNVVLWLLNRGNRSLVWGR